MTSFDDFLQWEIDDRMRQLAENMSVDELRWAIRLGRRLLYDCDPCIVQHAEHGEWTRRPLCRQCLELPGQQGVPVARVN